MVFGLLLILFISGCGGDEPEPDHTLVAALGDSISAGSPGYDPDPAQRAALGFGEDERSQFEYWAEQTDSGLRFRNCGVFGERTDEIAQRLDCAEGADALIVQGGINDIAQGRPVADAADDLLSLVVRGTDEGFDVYLAEVLPWNNGHPQADRPIAELNRRIRKIGRETGVAVLGFHDALEDNEQPAVMAAELTAEGDHPSVQGYRVLGQLVARELAAERR